MKCLKGTMTLLAALLVSACGGGGGEVAALGPDNDTGGIGGTGVSTSGPISGFSSVWVNGIKFESDEAMVSIDGAPATENDLRLGMIVRVNGTVDGNGITGVAHTIAYEALLIGPVTADPVTDTDLEFKHFQIYAFDVVAERDVTRFDSDDGTFSFDTLAAADVLEVSGFYDAATNAIEATHIERLQNLIDIPVRLFGVVSKFDGKNETFDIAGTNVQMVAPADPIDFPNGLSDGLVVELNGIVLANGTVESPDVRLVSDPFEGQSGEVRLEGVIRNYVSNSNFEVLGQLVDAGLAELEPSGATLADGRLVQVEGVLMANGVLIADTVELRESSVDITGVIASMDVATQMLSIELVTGAPALSVKVDGATQISDDSPLSFNQLMVGELVRVRGVNDGATILAHDINREDDDEVELEGPLGAYDEVAGTLTILGITYGVDANTQYEFDGVLDVATDRTTFFATLTLGAIVSIKDDLPADGIAEEVELDLGDDDILTTVVLGAVEDFDAAAGTLTVNQITFAIDQSTEFVLVDDGDEAIVDFDTFFDDLEVGLTIQVIDRDPVDRIADRARLEL